ncbi:putative histone acetyltransferase chromatin regulator PHD family [Helianthus debilis subsp. tardiflorus]
MKRELAFALEAQSQFGCFTGRTRSSESSPVAQLFTRSPVNRSVKVIDEVHVNRRNKRVKTDIPDGDLVNIEKSEGKEESEPVAVEEVVNGEEKSMAEDVVTAVTGGEESVVEVGEGLVEKVCVKRKKGKKEVRSDTPRRFTRSALKEKDENVEELATSSRKKLELKEKDENVVELGTSSRKKLELKMSKKIGLDRMPTNMRELLETGLLEGFRVYYKLGNEGKNLQGVIKGAGILCSCESCESKQVIAPSQFEMHARKSYRHAIKHIYLENGKNLLELIEICKSSASEPLEVALQTVISSLPAKEPSICTKCNSSFVSSSENLLICDSCLVNKEVDAEPGVATSSEVRTPNPEPKASESNSLLISSDKKTKRGRKRKTSSPEPKASESNSLLISPDRKTKRGRKRKSSKSATKPCRSSKSAMKPNKSAGNSILSQNKTKSKKHERSTRSASVPRPIKSAIKCASPQQSSRIKLTIKNQQLHWSVFQKGGLPDGTELTYVAQGKKLLDGYKWNKGIFCSCCKTEISASLFEAHAGRASHKKPYENIYISNGVSLHEYAVSMKMNEKGRCSVKYNDDLCRVCWDGGDLLLCDGCPRSFHQECAGESSIPHGKWYCRYCQNSMKVDGENQNALVAGRVMGIDPIEQIMTRCIRIVKHPENSDLVACVLCRCHDFSKTVFNERTVIVCDQCEKEYHIGCLREHNMADLKALPKGKWFCCKDCERINIALQHLITREPETLSDDLLTLLREKQKNNDNTNSETDSNSEMKFVVLSGKNATREIRKYLAQTVDIFHEGFDPIIDATTGRDFIPSMVYGRKIWSQDFAGMLIAILTIDSNVVSAGTLRVFGEDIAELPIVATSKGNQGKGYFQLLFTCIERLLSSLRIRKIVLPAAEEAKSIWTKKFGFETLDADQLRELRQTCSAMMTFKGTSMLQKEIPQAQNDVVDAAGDHGTVTPLVE